MTTPWFRSWRSPRSSRPIFLSHRRTFDAPQYWVMRSRPARRYGWASTLALAALLGCGGGGGAKPDGGAGGAPRGGAGGPGGAGAAGGSGGGRDGGAGDAGGAPVARAVQAHSAPIAVDPAGKQLFVVHPDADSVSIVDLDSRQILHEVLLAAAAPAVDINGRFIPAVGPRALALDSTGRTLYVTGQWSGSVYAIDVAVGNVTRATPASVCSEQIGVLVSSDDAHLFVACAQDDEVVELATADLSLVATAPCPRKPWALAWAGDGTTLAATHLLGPGVSRFATAPLSLTATTTLADGPAVGSPPDQTEP